MRVVDPDILRKLLSYDVDSGKLVWRYRGVDWFENVPHRSAEGVCATWNKRYAGHEAFTSTGPWGHKFGSVLGVHLAAHRVAWAIHFGIWPEGWLDHINGDPGDNRICNLRAIGPVGNARNASRSRRNKSGVTGVRWNAQQGKWHVQIGSGGRNQHIGFFDSFDAAVIARTHAEWQLDYHPNHGRAPHQMEKYRGDTLEA